MIRQNRQKASEKASSQVWNKMWQVFCPWVGGTDTTLVNHTIPSRRRRNRVRSMILALVLGGLMMQAAPALASQKSIVLASLATFTPSDRERSTSLFNRPEQRYSDIRPFTKWTGVLERFQREFPESMDKAEVRQWMHFIAENQSKSDEEKIEAVNRYMNAIPFVADAQNYGQRDYWATPMEFLAKGGDCEDYAVAKYITLRSLGVTKDKMRLAIVYDNVMRMPHALLVVYDRAQAKILDNQVPEVLNSADITRYKPIYSISQVAWWRH